MPAHSPPSPTKTIDVGLGGISIKAERLRALRSDRIAELAESMRVSGQLQPIVLRPGKGAGYHLVAGWHRYEAAKLLNWESIRANIFDGMTADTAELAEIDENLVHIDLTPAERAMHIARRKELYENLHPQTKAGSAGGRAKAGKRAQSQNETGQLAFIDDAANKTGRSRATVARDAKRGTEAAEILPDIVGTCLDKGDEIDALLELPPDEQNKLIESAKAGEKVSAKTRVKQIARQSRELGLGARQASLPQKRYGVILADPEWRFEPWSRETGMDRAADNHYPTSVTEVIAARPVADIAADDCVLFLWATVPMLPHALLVMAAWGFDYRSHFAWVKDRVGTGYWNRNKHELLLVGVRGNVPAPAPGTQWDSVVEAAVGEHSAKPKCFLEMIDEHFPTLPKIELNCRGQPWSGWDAWGNEVQEAAE